ncbi:reverse transcriptase domain-containing protein [Tanacetum coccineum]
MVPATKSLTSFSGETIWLLGQLRLLVTIGDAYHSTKAWMNFMIVRSLSPYNGIIGRPGIREIQAAPSTAHEMLKFPVDGGIVTIRSTILIPAKCATLITSFKEIPKEAGVCYENFKVALHPNFPNQEVAIGGMLSAKGRTELCSLLKKNLDIFAWQPSDMTGVPRSIAEHRLNIREGYSPVRQKKRCQALERAKAIQAEVGRNMEVYVDDLVIKSHTEAKMLRDIDETFWFMISPKGIKPCPDKTEVVLQLSSLRTIKEVQSLNGKLASLNRFLSKSAEKSLPLFKTLKKYIKKSDFHWTPEVEQAFKQLKQHLSELPLLAAPKPKEELIVYLSASHRAISAVLITERGMVQTPVYFVSRSLQGLELNYTPIEKLVLSLVFAAKRLQRYFQAHPEGTEFTYALRFQFTASNNEEEYEALIVGLRIAVQMEVRNVHVSVDSKLVSNQVLGTYVAKDENMVKYLEKAKSLIKKEVATVVEEEGPTWMTLIMEYLKNGTLSGDRKEASKLYIKARRYELLEGVLYRRSFLKPWLRTIFCSGQSHAIAILLANYASGCTRYDTRICGSCGCQDQRRSESSGSATVLEIDLVSCPQEAKKHCKNRQQMARIQ